MESNFTLVKQQQLATQGAVSLTYTEAGSMQFLAVANNRQNVISLTQDSAVYRSVDAYMGEKCIYYNDLVLVKHLIF